MSVPNAQATIAVVVGLSAILVLWQVSWLIVRWLGALVRVMVDRLPGSRAWARMHPLQAALQTRFPKAYALLVSRLTPKRFTGLPLTLFVAAALYLVSLLGGLIEELLETRGAIAFDSAFDALLQPFRVTPLVLLFAWITKLGESATLLAIALVSTGFLWAHERTNFILPLWVASLGSLATTWLGKFGFDRPRPEFVTDVTALSPAFPSAHTTGAMAVYGFVAYAIARDLERRRSRFEITFWTVVVVALVGFSRIFLSVHHTTDVAAGFLVGGFWLLVAFTLSETRRDRARRRGDELERD
jgi:membrane-associated phospholipid phosphatase